MAENRSGAITAAALAGVAFFLLTQKAEAEAEEPDGGGTDPAKLYNTGGFSLDLVATKPNGYSVGIGRSA